MDPFKGHSDEQREMQKFFTKSIKMTSCKLTARVSCDMKALSFELESYEDAKIFSKEFKAEDNQIAPLTI